MRDDEPRPVLTSLPITHWKALHRKPRVYVKERERARGGGRRRGGWEREVLLTIKK
jgi:hypothetical protein